MKIYGIDLHGEITVSTNGTYDIGDATHRLGDVYGTSFDGVATSSQYADLAERYTINGDYEKGDVILFDHASTGKDGIKSYETASNKILGVVSSNPGFLMDSKLDGGVPIALTGKVPCKVFGIVRRGDRLISSQDGGAIVAPDSNGQTVGRSLQNSEIIDAKIILIKI